MARVLVIDDEPVIRDVIVDALELSGHDVVAVADARSGLEAVRAGAYELVITDVVLPDSDGFSTIAVLGKEQPGLKFLAVSGGSEKLLEQYRRASGLDQPHQTLEKPFRIDELIRVVAELLA